MIIIILFRNETFISIYYSAVSRVYLNGAPASTDSSTPPRSAPGWKSNSSSPNSNNQRDDT